jgi:hypothetical protein
MYASEKETRKGNYVVAFFAVLKYAVAVENVHHKCAFLIFLFECIIVTA